MESWEPKGRVQSNHCEVAKSGCGAAEQEKSILKTAGVKSKIAGGGVEYRVRRAFRSPTGYAVSVSRTQYPVKQPSYFSSKIQFGS